MPQFLTSDYIYSFDYRKKRNRGFLFFYIFIMFFSFLFIDMSFRYINYGQIIDNDIIQIVLLDILWSLLSVFIVSFLPVVARVLILSTFIFYISFVSIVQTISISLTHNISSLSSGFQTILYEDMYTIIDNFSLIYLILFIPFVLVFSLSVSNVKLKVNFEKRFFHFSLVILALLVTSIYISSDKLANDVESNTNYDKLIYYEELDAISSRLGVTTYTFRSLYNEFSNENSRYNLENNSNLLGQLDSYLNQRNTKENDYTGILDDKNLILIQVDGLDYSVLNNNVMPTLSSLQAQGIYFNNYYSTYLVENGDTEFAVQTGIIPTDETNNITRFLNNGFTDSLVSLLNKDDYATMSVYTDSSYYRDDFYSNIGYDLYLDNNSLQVKDNNTFEVINRTTNLILDKNRFFVNYHFSFDNTLNTSIHEDFIDTDVNEDIKKYYSVSKQFDLALEKLLVNLTMNNKVNDTAIVIYGTHAPLNVLENEYETLSKVDRKGLNKFRAPLIIWNPNIDNTIVEEHIGPVDILPTLANMFSLSANYNNYIGEDIFSSGNNVVYFRNRSWVSNAGEYNTINQRFTIRDRKYLTDFLKIYIKNTNIIVEEKFTYSRIILERNYFVQIKV